MLQGIKAFPWPYTHHFSEWGTCRAVQDHQNSYFYVRNQTMQNAWSLAITCILKSLKLASYLCLFHSHPSFKKTRFLSLGWQFSKPTQWSNHQLQAGITVICYGLFGTVQLLHITLNPRFRTFRASSMTRGILDACHIH